MNWLFTSPGCDYTTNNFRGGRCAIGKFISKSIAFNPTAWDDLQHSIVAINNEGKNQLSSEECIDMWNKQHMNINLPIKDSYLPGDPRWPKHERALKIGLQNLVKNGVIEIEDEAAQEFGIIRQSVLASNVEEKVPV
jgi:hypothetical protein